MGLRDLLRRATGRPTEAVLARRLRLEALLAEVSAGMIHVTARDTEVAIERALRQVVTFLDVDRGSLDEHVDGTRGLHVSWARPGLAEPPQIMATDEFPWVAGRLRSGEVVRFSRLDELPATAVIDRASFERGGTRAKVLIPVQNTGPIRGVLSFASVRDGYAWPDDLVKRLRFLGEVFAGVLDRRELTESLAHELSQPLAAILSNAQAAQRLVAADVVDLEGVREILGDIVADDKRAAAVINGLRVLIKKGEPEFVPLDINEVVGEVAWLMRSDVILRNVSMSLDLAPDLPSVRGDRVQLQQVVLNLVLNGLEAMREPHAGPRTLVIRTIRDSAAALRVTVQDSGPGIAEQDLGHIFQPLYTTQTEGLGMGLAIVRTIVNAHGGVAGAENNPQGGASLHFTLPVHAEGEQ